MKILHIISSLSSGGAEVYVIDLSKQMVKDGHDVCIAYISEAKAMTRCPNFEQNIKSQLQMCGIQFAEIGHECRVRVWRGGRELKKIVFEFRPDMIHAHLYYGLIFKILSRVNTPTVYTHHNMQLGKGKFLYPLFNMSVSKYIGISKDCTMALQSTRAHDITTIYNGVSLDRLLVKDKYFIKNEKITIQAVGTLSDQKNFVLLIDSFGIFLKKYPEWKNRISLDIAGEGPLKDKLQKRINSANLSNQITLLGIRRDIPALLHESDLFIMSSAWEGLPISLLEAMMTGLPVIVTDVGGCRDIVLDCNAGLVVPPGNAIAIADAINFMINHPNQRLKMADNARKKSNRFNIKYSCKKHYFLYNSLL